VLINGVPFIGPCRSSYGAYDKRYLTIHNTSNDATPVQEANYAKTRTDGVGMHLTSDTTTVIQTLDTVRGTGHVGSRVGNDYGISVEIVGFNSYDSHYWTQCVDRLLHALTQVCRTHGIPPRWLTLAQMRDGRSKGLITHDMARQAWGGTTHTDPGPNFPRQYLADQLGATLGGVGGSDTVTGGRMLIMTQVQGSQAVQVSDGFQYRGLSFAAFQRYQALGVPFVVFPTEAARDEFAGVPFGSTVPEVELTPEQLEAIEEAAREGAQAGSSGATVDEVREVVDEQLDQRFNPGADPD
jgi:N-acetylmuramoyl-L-alanine amidase